ncbi:MAG TPA: hypothetical protein VH350_18800 [Candidatus Sulfotelmatobacter sp.]|jgi:hypothetical protein|nr:hypothetical protein [Candidatus Sulfotelmatobacter sp.]
MKSRLLHAALALSVLGLTVFSLSASARDIVLPAGTLLQCTLNEPNMSTASMDVGDPVLCHLRGVTEFGQQAFPRGSYLVGHLDSAKDPGHFWGKGYLKIQFDRIGLPTGDLPLEAKVISTRGYRVDKQGKIDGKGHPRRDVIEWMLPPLWPWKVIMLPARGPRPTLKGETVLSLRLMDDVQIPQVAKTFGPNWHFFSRDRDQSQNYQPSVYDNKPQVMYRNTSVDGTVSTQMTTGQVQASYASLVTRAIPSVANSAPGMPVFVLNNGTVLAVSGYGYQDSRISYSLVDGGTGVISTSDIDWSTTTRLNEKRGVRLSLHAAHEPQGTPGF